MFIQNLKGLITILLIVAFFGTVFFGYKLVLEPKIKGNSLEQLPVDTENPDNEEIKITPQIEIFKNRAIIRFKTPYDSDAFVLFDSAQCAVEKCKKIEDTKGTDHKIVLSDLTPNTKYFYKLGIDNDLYPPEEEFFTFITLEDASSSSNSNNSNNTKSEPSAKNENTTQPQKLDLKTFKEAIKAQDLKYDFNKDGKVNILDYSLYKKSN